MKEYERLYDRRSQQLQPLLSGLPPGTSHPSGHAETLHPTTRVPRALPFATHYRCSLQDRLDEAPIADNIGGTTPHPKVVYREEQEQVSVLPQFLPLYDDFACSTNMHQTFSPPRHLNVFLQMARVRVPCPASLRRDKAAEPLAML